MRFQGKIRSLSLDMINFRCLLDIQAKILSRQLATQLYESGSQERGPILISELGCI